MSTVDRNHKRGMLGKTYSNYQSYADECGSLQCTEIYNAMANADVQCTGQHKINVTAVGLTSQYACAFECLDA